MEIRATKSADSAQGFLKNLMQRAPFVISKILTDNGKEYTDRFCATGQRKPTGNHVFDKVCATYGIEHRLIKPRHPQIEKEGKEMKKILLAGVAIGLMLGGAAQAEPYLINGLTVDSHQIYYSGSNGTLLIGWINS